MLSLKKFAPLFLALVIAAVFSTCGGGGESGGGSGLGAKSSDASVDGKVLHWSAPQRYANGTTLSTTRVLEGYEIFVNESGYFSVNDKPVLWVPATDSRGNLVESLNLNELEPYYSFSANQSYFFSLRAVANNGETSAFSQSLKYRF